jgi:hypothetical protein
MSAVVLRDKPPEVVFMRKPFSLDQLIDVIATPLARNGHRPRMGGAHHYA